MTSHPRSGRRTSGRTTVSSASTATITPSAWPDGNEALNACTSAVSGRGRSAACLAASVTSPLSSTVMSRNIAMRMLRRSSATTITTRVTTRKAIGPNTVQNTCHPSTQPGWASP